MVIIQSSIKTDNAQVSKCLAKSLVPTTNYSGPISNDGREYDKNFRAAKFFEH